MISKERLLKGYIKNDLKQGIEILNKWKESSLAHGFSDEYVDEGFEENEVFFVDGEGDMDAYLTLQGFLKDYPLSIELTLEDFEEESSPEQDKGQTSQYRYEVVGMTPAEIYSAMLNGETFYVNEQEMYWNGNTFWCDCERVRFIEDDHEVCRKVEITWRDEVEDFMKSVTTDGEYSADYSLRTENGRYHMIESDFVEMCKKVAEANK